MDDLEGQTIHSCIGTFQSEVLSWDAVDTRAHICPTITCPYCGRTGQFQIMVGKHYANYCPGCEITWRWKFERKEV